MKKIILTILILLLVTSVLYLALFKNQSNNTDTPIKSNQQNAEFNKEQYSLTDPASPWVIVNKKRPLSPDYVPQDLVDANITKYGQKSKEEYQLRAEAARKLEEMAKGATNEGIEFVEGSGYRSFQLQRFYYDNYVSQSGQAEADKFSARPGTSEHQTGWAADLGTKSGICYLEKCFGVTPEGLWIKANAHKYGFIIRYPEGKELVTGYQYEPWHVRYVGKSLAKEIYGSGKTLEEYFEQY